jgi:nicotinate-nucleotide pyrophosphorylase
MKIFGHEWIESESFYEVTSIEEISKTPANSLIKLAHLPKTLELAKHCQSNALRYALEVKNIEEAIFANLLNATYILCEKELAKELMPIAQNYLFDTQVLAYIKKDEIEEMAKFGVDGVIIG